MTEPDESPREPRADRPRPAGAVPWERVELDAGFTLLARALRLALVVVVLLVGCRLLLSLWGIASADPVEDLDATSWAGEYDRWDGRLTVATLVALVVTAALWLRWQYLLARAASPGELTRSPVWHVTSWFLPVFVAWWPYQNVRDLWWIRSRGWGAATIGWWWSAVVAAVLIDQMVVAAQDNVESVQDFQDLLVLDSAAAVAALVAGVLALLIQGRLSSVKR